MDDEIERLVIGVRADTAGFARDVDAMRGNLEGPFAAGVERAGRGVEAALARAIGSGKLGFDDLRKVALAVMADIATAAVKSGLNEAFGGSASGSGGGGSGGTAGLAATILSLFSGSPGRATGGPVSPGRPYMVGERGPELFVPTASGSIASGGGGSAREVRVAITVNAGAGESPKALAASSRQVARAVRAALLSGD